MYACMYVCMYVFMYVCIYIFVPEDSLFFQSDEAVEFALIYTYVYIYICT
jgi:hypothetical protein